MAHGSKNRVLISLAVVLVAAGLAGPHVWAHPEDKGTVEEALHSLVEQGEITEPMHRVFDELYENGNAEKLAHYLESLAKRGEISAEELQDLMAVGQELAELESALDGTV